jgi:hypothetical protein
VPEHVATSLTSGWNPAFSPAESEVLDHLNFIASLFALP